jgi:hypothetical protein
LSQKKKIAKTYQLFLAGNKKGLILRPLLRGMGFDGDKKE